MYDELVKRLRNKAGAFDYDGRPDIACDYEQAADAIEALAASVEGFEAQTNMVIDRDGNNTVIRFEPRWIPVTERLPELHDAEYLDEATGELVRYKESMPVLIWLAKGGFMDIGIYEKSDAVDDFCYQGIPHTVTHWMPLPEPPKEGET